MLTVQRQNQWNEKYHTGHPSAERKCSETRSLSNSVNNGQRFGGNRSTTSSISRGQNNEYNFGIWGKKTTQEYYQNRDSSPAFGATRVRAIKED